MDNKDLFIKWVENKNITGYKRINESIIKIVMEHLNADNPSLFEENSPEKIREYAAKLIMSKENSGIDSVYMYATVILLFVYYAEYLELLQEPEERFQSNINKEQKDIYLIGYYLSRLDMKGINLIGYTSSSEAMNELAKLFEVKSTFLKNIRDTFDPYFNNDRVGWYQRALRGYCLSVYKKYENVTDNELIMLVKNILSEKRNKDKYKKTDHTILKLSENSMKEIKNHIK